MCKLVLYSVYMYCYVHVYMYLGEGRVERGRMGGKGRERKRMEMGDYPLRRWWSHIGLCHVYAMACPLLQEGMPGIPTKSSMRYIQGGPKK